MVRANVEYGEFVPDRFIVAKIPCATRQPRLARPRVAEWFVAFPASKAVVFPLVGFGVGFICFAVSRREVEQTTDAVFSGPAKQPGRQSNLKPCLSGFILSKTSLSAG